MLIGTRADSDRFLYDLRRTISDLHATEHYGTIATVARRNGLTLYGEALEDQRPVMPSPSDVRCLEPVATSTPTARGTTIF